VRGARTITINDAEQAAFLMLRFISLLPGLDSFSILLGPVHKPKNWAQAGIGGFDPFFDRSWYGFRADLDRREPVEMPQGDTMFDSTYSLVFDRKSAARAFKQVGAREIMLAVLAGIPPEAAWDGCLVYVGEPTVEQAGQACIGIRGPAADTVQQRLVEGLEKIGIKIIELYEGGPEPSEPIATASGGKWSAPA
jgi:hypothetical protein